MKAETQILIADDHPIFRTGLRQIIEANAGLQVVAEAEDGPAALRWLQELKPEVAILDLSMPKLDGFDVLEEIRRRRLAVESIILTMHNEEATFQRAVSLGAKGYVLKDSAGSDIVNAIKAVTSGQRFTSPAITTYLFQNTARGGQLAPSLPSLDDLSPTERRILRLIVEYKTSKEIADELCISHRTVENYRSNICTKLGLHGSHALIKFALKHKAAL
jgi:DNA-binding NarL/FixJ family response regulator